VATYDYTDEDDALLFQAVRYDPKDFKQRQLDGKGGWIWNLKGVRRVLYRLPELMAADPAKPVFIVEGEKDANRLIQQGLIATTNPMGAKKWLPEYSGYLEGRHVVIVPDNDREGQEHAVKVAYSVQGVAKSVRVLELSGLPPKGDVSDWLDAGGTAEELVELVSNLSAWEQTSQAHSVDSVDSVQGWENPQPFASVEVPRFPIDALPPELAEYVSQEAEAKQVPQDLPGCLVLGATAAAVAGKAKVFLNDDWTEPLNNNFVSVLPSGERKSPEFREIFHAMEEKERQLVATKTPEIVRAQTERDILEKRLQNMKTDAAKAKSQAERDGAEVDARELATQLARFEIPVAPRLLADDATPEAVAGLLAEQKGRLAIISTEGGIFEIIAGRYSESVPNLDVYLKAYSGDTIRVDRRSRPAEFIADPCLTVVLTVQPDVIRDLSSKRGFRGRGFLARWNYSLPNSKVGFRNTDAPTVHPGVRAKWMKTLTAILELPYPGDIDTPLIQLSPWAWRKFQAFRKDVEVELRPGGELDGLVDWGNKLCGNVVRIAGLLHTLSWAGGSGYPWDNPISPETMADAISLGKYFKEHAKAAFALMGADGRLASAQSVWDTIVRHKLEDFTVRDLWQKVRRSFSKVTDLEEVLNLLVDLGYIRQVEVLKREGPGQRPSPRYEVNPKALTQNTQGTQNAVPGDINDSEEV